MQSDAPATEQPVADLAKAGSLEERGEILWPGKAANAGREVRVRLSARKHPARERDEHVEPEAEERAQEAARPCYLEHGDLAFAAEDTVELAQPSLEIVEVANSESDGHRVELPVGEWQRQRVAPNPLDRPRLASRALEHPLGEVQPDDLRSPPLRLDREIARTATCVEHAIARPDHLSYRQAPPASVEPRGHQPVHHVVDRGDAVEHPADLVGGQASRLVRHSCPQRFASTLSMPSWSRQRATRKSTRSSIDSGAW